MNYFETLKQKVSPLKSPIRSKHIAGIWLDGHLVVTGVNSKKSHPLQARFASKYEKIYLHAEIDALRKFLRLYSIHLLSRATLVVIRVRADGTFGGSRPCSGCMRAIVSFGVGECYWSDTDK